MKVFGALSGFCDGCCSGLVLARVLMLVLELVLMQHVIKPMLMSEQEPDAAGTSQAARPYFDCGFCRRCVENNDCHTNNSQGGLLCFPCI